MEKKITAPANLRKTTNYHIVDTPGELRNKS